MSDELLYEVRGRVAILTINRPERRNALNRAVREGLRAGWARVEADPDIRAAILTGAGGIFCAGADLVEMSDTAMAVPARDHIPILGDNIRVSKPVIAAVNGGAYAGGFLMTQMCDLCIAADTAVFAITEGKVGRGMPWAAPLIHMLPQRIALELLMTAKPITAARAYELGYVNRVVAGPDLLDAALEMANDIVANAPLTVAAAKEMIYAAGEMGRSAALNIAHRIFEPVYTSADAQEGPLAFKEKRKPRWQGK